MNSAVDTGKEIHERKWRDRFAWPVTAAHNLVLTLCARSLPFRCGALSRAVPACLFRSSPSLFAASPTVDGKAAC